MTEPNQTLKQNGFVFATEDFDRCFNSPAGHILSSEPFFVVTDQAHGHFHFVGSQTVSKPNKRRCNIGIMAPENKILLFEVLDMTLQCGNGSVSIFKSPTIDFTADPLRLCGSSLAAESFSRHVFPFQCAYVSFSMFTFSAESVVRLKFSAVSPSERPVLQHIQLSENKGLRLSCFL